MGNSGLTRRGFLGAAGTGLAVSVSGCSSSDTDGASSDMSDIDIAKPVVQSDNMDGWKETNAREMKLSAQLGTTPYVSFRTFENVAFRSRVRGLTLGEFDSPLAKFFAAHYRPAWVHHDRSDTRALGRPCCRGIKGEHEAERDTEHP